MANGSGPPQGTHTEERFVINDAGQVVRRQVQVENVSPVNNPRSEYRYYRKPDGTVVRQQVTPQPAPRAAPPPAPRRTAPPPPAARPPARRPMPTSSWTPNRIGKHLAVIAIILILLFASWPILEQPVNSFWNLVTTGDPGFQFFPEEADFIIMRETSLEARSNGLTYEIDISKPYHIEGIHEIVELTPTPSPTREYTYKEHEWMEWKGSIQTGERVTLRIKYHMRLYSTLWEIDEGDSAKVTDIPAEYDKYLGTEWKITPDDPAVAALAQDIAGSETNVYKILLKLYKWMDDNLRYEVQRTAEPKSCTQTMADKSGDCDDQSILLASMARSLGVPVWLNLGIIYDPVRDYWGGHGWNNVYIPLKNGKHAVCTVDIVNNQFLFRDPYHVSDYLDNGDGDDLRAYYTSWSYSYTGRPPNAVSEETYEVLSINPEGSVTYYSP